MKFILFSENMRAGRDKHGKKPESILAPTAAA